MMEYVPGSRVKNIKYLMMKEFLNLIKLIFIH